jgi:hypothetical protein
VIQGHLRPEAADGGDLRRAAGQPDDERAGVQRGLGEQGTEAAGRGRDHDDVVLGQRRGLEHEQRGAAGADHRDGDLGTDAGRDPVQPGDVRHRLLGVPLARRAEVRDDVPAEPRRVGARAERLDPAGHLPPRDGGQGRRLQRSGRLAAAQPGVEQVDAGRRDGDPHLPLAGLRVRDLLEHQVLRGSELVQPDRAHDRERRS